MNKDSVLTNLNHLCDTFEWDRELAWKYFHNLELLGEVREDYRVDFIRWVGEIALNSR